MTDESLDRVPRKVVVVGVRGGTGATLVACHLSVFLARRLSVCLVDLDVAGGDIAAVLDLQAELSINDLLSKMDGADEALVRGSVLRHESGVHALPQPWDPTDLPDPSREEVARLITLLSGHFEVTVVDAGVALSVPALAACAVAEEVVVILHPQVVDLRALQRLRLVLDELGIPESRLRLVMNEGGRGSGLSREEVEEHTGLRVVSVLPSDPWAVSQADRLGRLLYDVAPRSPLTRAMGGLWPRLRGATTDDDEGRGAWRWLTRG